MGLKFLAIYFVLGSLMLIPITMHEHIIKIIIIISMLPLRIVAHMHFMEIVTIKKSRNRAELTIQII